MRLSTRAAVLYTTRLLPMIVLTVVATSAPANAGVDFADPRGRVKAIPPGQAKKFPVPEAASQRSAPAHGRPVPSTIPGLGRGRPVPAPQPARPARPAPAYGVPADQYEQLTIRDRRGRSRQVFRAARGQGFGRDGRIVIINPRPAPIPGRYGQLDADEFAAEMFVRQSQNLSCGEIGELVRRVSNEILEASATADEFINHYDVPEQKLRKARANRLRQFLKRPVFAQIVMERLSVAFAGCDQTCFEDGFAVGVISGTGYCNASVGVGGLDDDGFRFQQRLPMCETANFVGCQNGYSQAVNAVHGCLGYATGNYLQTFLHSVSQDCHVD